ncbi:MAG: bifunctional helix-turn-helix transcriptional regulator/GNAT family N-acetyltransferase [Acidobacteriota bacterium]
MVDDSATAVDLERDVEAVRRFNRFYTQRIGVLGQLAPDLGLPAARVLFEVERVGEATVGAMAEALGLDGGYASRLVSQLERKGLVARRRCPDDARRRRLELTYEGRIVHAELTVQANAGVAAMLEPLGRAGRRRLVAAFETAEHLLGGPRAGAVRLREHGPGDLGWMLTRHAEFYRYTYGFDHRFEALVALLISRFAAGKDPRRERLWIADDGVERLGSIALAGEGDDPDAYRLRLFFVEPHAQGRGIGRQLIDTLMDFARRRGGRRMVLSTVNLLAAARHLYEQKGFRLVGEQAHSDWSVPVVEEDWEVELSDAHLFPGDRSTP